MIVFSNRSLKAEDLEPNTGQIPGVPANPRKWTKDALASLAKSIEETPELLAARRILVYPYGDKFVVLGGNMRLAACLSLGYDEMPCVVIEEPDGEIPAEKLKEIVVKDNGSFGDWDTAKLEEAWGDLPLSDWGIPVEWENVNADDFGDSFNLPSGDKKIIGQMTLTLSSGQLSLIKTAIESAKHSIDFASTDMLGNENSNGNAIYYIVKSWEEQRK